MKQTRTLSNEPGAVQWEAEKVGNSHSDPKGRCRVSTSGRETASRSASERRSYLSKPKKVVIYDRLPEPQEGVLYIVPQEVAEAVDGRDDLAYPHFELVKKGLVAVTEPHKPAR